jgi:hypothetical protein
MHAPSPVHYVGGIIIHNNRIVVARAVGVRNNSDPYYRLPGLEVSASTTREQRQELLTKTLYDLLRVRADALTFREQYTIDATLCSPQRTVEAFFVQTNDSPQEVPHHSLWRQYKPGATKKFLVEDGVEALYNGLKDQGVLRTIRPPSEYAEKRFLERLAQTA